MTLYNQTYLCVSGFTTSMQANPSGSQRADRRQIMVQMVQHSCQETATQIATAGHCYTVQVHSSWYNPEGKRSSETEIETARTHPSQPHTNS